MPSTETTANDKEWNGWNKCDKCNHCPYARMQMLFHIDGKNVLQTFYCCRDAPSRMRQNYVWNEIAFAVAVVACNKWRRGRHCRRQHRLKLIFNTQTATCAQLLPLCKHIQSHIGSSHVKCSSLSAGGLVLLLDPVVAFPSKRVLKFCATSHRCVKHTRNSTTTFFYFVWNFIENIIISLSTLVHCASHRIQNILAENKKERENQKDENRVDVCTCRCCAATYKSVEKHFVCTCENYDFRVSLSASLVVCHTLCTADVA